MHARVNRALRQSDLSPVIRPNEFALLGGLEMRSVRIDDVGVGEELLTHVNGGVYISNRTSPTGSRKEFSPGRVGRRTRIPPSLDGSRSRWDNRGHLSSQSDATRLPLASQTLSPTLDATHVVA